LGVFVNLGFVVDNTVYLFDIKWCVKTPAITTKSIRILSPVKAFSIYVFRILPLAAFFNGLFGRRLFFLAIPYLRTFLKIS